jgi:hypothetical protein
MVLLSAAVAAVVRTAVMRWGGIGVAGLGQMDLIAQPAGLSLGGEARLRYP